MGCQSQMRVIVAGAVLIWKFSSTISDVIWFKTLKYFCSCTFLGLDLLVLSLFQFDKAKQYMINMYEMRKTHRAYFDWCVKGLGGPHSFSAHSGIFRVQKEWTVSLLHIWWCWWWYRWCGRGISYFEMKFSFSKQPFFFLFGQVFL